MINLIVGLFYDLARQHKDIMAFKYGEPSKVLGSGEDLFPLVHLEEPIVIETTDMMSPTIDATVNFQILCSSAKTDNEDRQRPSAEENESTALNVCMQFVAYIRRLNKAGLCPFSVLTWDAVTLTNHTDDDADGIRCTLRMQRQNPILLCDFDKFDEEKEFPTSDLLPEIDTDDAEGCVKFGYKFPKLK